MVAEDEDALICDMAQYYHVLNWRGLPLRLAAVLAAGLPAESRTIRRMSGQRHTAEELYSALIIDRLSLLVWQNTADGQKGRNQPKSLFDSMVHEADKPHIQSFDSAADFEAAREKIIGGQ